MRRARPPHAPRIIEEFHGRRSGARGQAWSLPTPIDAHNCGQFAAVLPSICSISLTKSEFLQGQDGFNRHWEARWHGRTSMSSLRKTLTCFFKARDAGVAPMLAFAAIPLVATVGAA